MYRVIHGQKISSIGAPRRRVKRWFDIGLTLLAAPFFLPVMAMCAIAVLLESGRPVFFMQDRTGIGGRRFKMYKFRTMVPDAERLKHELAPLNELTWPDFKISDDPRVTCVGRFLRRTSLDELPQLLNVLKGNMTLVGPRPTSFKADTYDLWHTERLEVLPGVTGLWQISGRSDIDFDDRVRLDIKYIQNQSLLYDFRILTMTVVTMISQRGAY